MYVELHKNAREKAKAQPQKSGVKIKPSACALAGPH
jgi:hypothetical protein